LIPAAKAETVSMHHHCHRGTFKMFSPSVDVDGPLAGRRERAGELWFRILTDPPTRWIECDGQTPVILNLRNEIKVDAFRRHRISPKSNEFCLSRIVGRNSFLDLDRCQLRY
jgi:hypothetical protein